MKRISFFVIYFISLFSFSQNPYDGLCAEFENGEHSFEYSNGIPRATFFVLNGEFDGVYKSYLKNGTQLAQTSFDNGLMDGLSISNNRKGAMRSEEKYRKDTLLSFRDFRYYFSGQKKDEFIIEFDDDSASPNWQKHTNPSISVNLFRITYRVDYFFDYYNSNGTYTEFYRNGGLKTVFKMKNGLFDGKSVAYYKNGAVKWDYAHKKDELDGFAYKYSKKGELLKTLNYVKGKKSQ